jgi:16S rRNA (cytosine967-C5)-methyltransferase
VQRAALQLDYGIETLGKRPVRKLDPPVRTALRLGAYQLGYLEVAPHAAVNESVELVRAARLERARAVHQCGDAAAERRPARASGSSPGGAA